MLENSFSAAIRLMLGLPRDSHRYFLEPLSGSMHVKSDLIKRFLNFVHKIKRSGKLTLNYVLNVVSNDVRSTTGKNLLNIKTRVGKGSFESIRPRESVIPFRMVPEGQHWRISIAQELIECRNRTMEIPGFSSQEMEKMLSVITTTGPS